MVDVLVHAPNSATGLFDPASVAEDEGIEVIRVDPDRSDADATVAQLARPGVAYRSAGGLLAGHWISAAPSSSSVRMPRGSWACRSRRPVDGGRSPTWLAPAGTWRPVRPS